MILQVSSLSVFCVAQKHDFYLFWDAKGCTYIQDEADGLQTTDVAE